MIVCRSHISESSGARAQIYDRWSSTCTIILTFGTAGKMIGQFGTVNAIDCREENDLLVGELGNWSVQRVTLQPMR